jgi:putative ABC transport system permease protein
MDREPPSRRYKHFWGTDPTQDVNEELAFHLAMRTEEFRRSGMSEQEATEAVMKRFGDVNEIRGEVEAIARSRHARRRRAWHLDAIRQDLRFAVRALISNPGFTLVVALTLALGIGANTAVFSVAYGVLLRPLPYRDADQLVRLWSKNDRRNLEFFSVSPADYADWRVEARSFTAMAAFERQHDATLATRDQPLSISMASVTPDIFALLGTSPALGRALVGDDAASDSRAVVVMSQDLWVTQFGSDPTLVGKDITLDGRRYMVVGVMPSRFVIPGTPAQLWAPLSLSGAPTLHSNRYLRVLGRLAPSVSPENARRELDVIAQRIAQTFPADAAGWSTNMMSVPEMIVGTQFKRAILTLVGVVAFVLLISCANAANLQLARSAGRNREMAIRGALGASRGRIALQLLTESTVISVVAGGAGLLLAYMGIAVLRRLGTTTVPRLDDVRLDAPALLFTMAIALGSGMLFGLIPAMRASRANAGEILKGARGAGQSAIGAGVRGALVVAEIALSLVLLIGAGLLVRSFARVQAVDLGFDERRLFVASLRLPESTYPTPEATNVFFASLLDRARLVGGVDGAALVNSAPFAGPNTGNVFLPAGESPPVGAQPPAADTRIVSSGYFRAMGIRILRGRDIAPGDREDAPGVVVINATMAKKHWPNQDPVGRQIRIGDVVNGPLTTIVGVVADSRYQSLESEPSASMMYLSWHARPQRSMTIVARSRSDAAASQAVATLRTTLASQDRRLPAPAITPMEQLVGTAMATRRFALTLFGVFAATAVMLAAIGLYGVLAFLVKQRTHELGVRAALGAPRKRLLMLVVGGALRLTTAGVAIGLFGAYALTGLLGSLLFGVSATDPVTFVALPLLLAVVAVSASLIPGARATRADPMSALRGE